MNRQLLDRRRFLAALGASALAYPFLRSLPSYAAGGDPPRYLILVFTPSGVVQHLFGAEAASPGASPVPTIASPLVLRESLSPLEPLKDRVAVVEGLAVKAAGMGSHEAGMAALWTGAQSGDTGQGPTIDQAIAKQLNAGRPFQTVELMVRSSADWVGREVKTRMIYAGAGAYMDPIDDPVAARSTLFPSAVSSGAGAGPDKKAFIRGKLFAQLNTELTSLQSKLCSEDRVQLQAVQSAWNEVDAQLKQVATAAQACTAPAAAPSDYKSPSLDFPTSAKLQMDILAMALACDLTRVISLQFSTATSQVTHTWLGANQTSTHHDFSHQGPSSEWSLGSTTDPYSPAAASSYSALAQLSAIDKWYASQVHYLANALNQFSAGGNKLLDQSIICWGSEVALGAAHSHNNAPFVLIGGGGGKLETNQCVRIAAKYGPDQSTAAVVDRSHNDLLLTLARAMGSDLSTFGDPSLCTGPITQLLV